MKVFIGDPTEVIPNFNESDFIIITAKEKGLPSRFHGIGYVDYDDGIKKAYVIKGSNIDRNSDVYGWLRQKPTKLLSCINLWNINHNSYVLTFIVPEDLDDLKQVLSDVDNKIIKEEITQKYLVARNIKLTKCRQCGHVMTPVYITGDIRDNPSEYACDYCGTIIKNTTHHD